MRATAWTTMSPERAARRASSYPLIVTGAGVGLLALASLAPADVRHVVPFLVPVLAMCVLSLAALRLEAWRRQAPDNEHYGMLLAGAVCAVPFLLSFHLFPVALVSNPLLVVLGPVKLLGIALLLLAQRGKDLSLVAGGVILFMTPVDLTMVAVFTAQTYASTACGQAVVCAVVVALGLWMHARETSVTDAAAVRVDAGGTDL